MPLNEAIRQFIAWKGFASKECTTKGYFLSLRQFAIFQRNGHIEEVSIKDVIEWFALMKQVDYERNSFIPKAMALRKLFEYYRRQDLQVLNPELIPVPEKEWKFPRVATEENYKKLLAVIPENNDPRHIRNRAMINLLWDTGARVGEIVSLNMSDIDMEKMQAVIRTEKSKGHRPVRQIFWTETTKASLENWFAKREHLGGIMPRMDEQALFISVNSQKSGKRLMSKSIEESLRKYSRLADTPYMNPHSFRHHMGHQIVAQGGSNAVVSGILGHSSPLSSFVYTMLNDEELRSNHQRYARAI